MHVQNRTVVLSKFIVSLDFFVLLYQDKRTERK